MKISEKSDTAYKTIGEVAKKVGLINKDGSLQTHTLRFWEKQFRQIRPTVKAGNRRYYSDKDLKIIKLVKHLLKDQGMTIKGVKKILSSVKTYKLDDNPFLGKNASIKKSKLVKQKINKITKIIKDIKNLSNG